MSITGEDRDNLKESLITHEDQLFESKVWGEPLAKFSKATGLTISLFDKGIHRQGEVITSGPIGEKLLQAGFWEHDGLGTRIDLEAALKCADQKSSVYTLQFDLFSHLAIPLFVDKEIKAVFVLGWLPGGFADPVICDLFSKKIQALPMEIWQIMRMQQPMSQEKLERHAGLLETFSVPLIGQLQGKLEEAKRAQRSKIISETALTFAEATTESEICHAALRSIQMLVKGCAVSIEITKNKDDEEERPRYELIQNINTKNEMNVRRHLMIPIPSLSGQSVGTIEVQLQDLTIRDDTINDLRSVAAQFGMALQKVHLIQALENERSALKGANVQLHHLHQMKDEFLATVSHELRTPLNAILGWAQILKEDGEGSRDFPKAIETIERNAKNQSRLIEDLLDVSRIISGKMILQRQKIEATSLLEQSIQTIYPMTEARRQKVHLQISPSPIFLKGDATRITQIFWNILSNASKFTPENGDISVVLKNAGHYFKFEVSDTGKGISEEFLPNIFNRFSQADGSFTRRHGGLGLGLAIVRHLVELHGGNVTAKSRGENQGSTFTIYLPQNTTDVELDSAHEISQFSKSHHKKIDLQLKGVRILLIDDEPDSLRLTRFVLEKCGASIQIADSAEEGYQKLREWSPDILISDLSMPGESGFDLIRRVRYLSSEEGGRIPAVALTALASSDQKNRALNAGFQTHLAKPFEPNKLAKCVMDLLKKSESSQQYRH